MKAMVLAAGLGTRLRPLTDTRPKALVELAGRTLLEITLERLRSFGIREVIVNVHHLGDMIVDYLKANGSFGMRIEISREELLLDTGGGLKKAAWFFDSEPFILHNVDVVSSIDLQRMADYHRQREALATLAVQDRETSRYLIFDNRLRLIGRRSTRDPERSSLGFSGVHVISPGLIPMMEEEGAFSIITTYLRLAARGENIAGFRADDCYWRDLGRPDQLAQAEKEIREGAAQGAAVPREN
jgi:NDP-sugar pyrophosphorylase family protein